MRGGAMNTPVQRMAAVFRMTPRLGADGFVHGLDAATAVDGGIDAHAGENLYQEEAEKADDPVLSAGFSQKRRENQVPGPEEHGEQGKAGDKNLSCPHL